MGQVDNAQHHKQQHKGGAQPCQQFVCPVGKAKPRTFTSVVRPMLTNIQPQNGMAGNCTLRKTDFTNQATMGMNRYPCMP